MNHYNLVIPIPKAIKIPDAKAAVGKECKWLETIPAWKLEKVHFASLMDIGTWKTRSWNRNFRSTKDMSYSVVTLLKMTQTHMLCSLNKARLRHRLLLPRSWMWLQNCQIVKDKQQMRYQLTPTLNWKMFQDCMKFRSQNVRTYGYAFQDTSGRKLGPVWKTQLFLLSGIGMVICYQDCCGNGSLKFYLNLDEKSAELGLSFCSQETRIILVGVRGRHQNGWKEAEYGTHVVNWWRMLILTSLRRFSITYTWGCAQRECKPKEIIIEDYTKMFESRISAGATENYLGRKNLTQKQLHGPMMWKDMPKSMWKDTADWKRRKMSNCRKFQVIAWMDIILRRRNLNQWRIITSDFTNCVEMLVLDTNWTTWYLVVCQ